VEITDTRHIPKTDIPNVIIELEAEMMAAADRLEFERAIQLPGHRQKAGEGIEGGVIGS